jgi:outer membrane protein
MDNQKQTLINILLAVAVVVLIILQLTTNKGEATSTAMDKPMTAEDSAAAILSKAPKSVSDLKIAYVNSDSVTKYYDLAKLLEADLMSKQATAESKLKGMYGTYEKKKIALEKEYKILGQTELNQRMEELGKLEQEIMMKEQELSQKFAQEEMEITNDYILKTNQFMQNIGKQLGYDYIFSFRLGGQMLFANPELDITQDIIVLINKEYHSALSK